MTAVATKSPRTRRAYDPDRGGTTTPGLKAARRMEAKAKAERMVQHEDLRDMDSEMSGTPGYSASHIDSQRHMPASKTADLGHPRKKRQLPKAGEVRQPVSRSQKRQRHIASREAQKATPRTEMDATRRVLGSQDGQRLNDQLSKHTGNAHELPAGDERTARRMDRMIQRSTSGATTAGT